MTATRPAALRPKTVIAIVIFSILFLRHMPYLCAQHIIGTYTTSTLEASLFFLNPGYLSPAFGSGALGMQSNPAGLHHVKQSRLSIVYATAQSSSTEFSFQPPLQNDFYEPIRLETRMDIRESGGLGAIGFAHRTGNWVWGLSIMQPRTGGLSVQAQGSIDLTTQFELETPITKEIYSDLPVDEIPVTWDINTTGRLSFYSTPADVSLSMQPIMAGFSIEKGNISFGAGLTYCRFFSSNEIGEIYTELEADATITGKPRGIDPFSNVPWNGRIVADLSILDDPVRAQYQFDISGHRFALSLGGMMNFKYASFGIHYSHGIKSSLKGAYNITAITSVDLQDRDILSDVDLDLTMQPDIEGHASLHLYDFKKDTTLSRDRGVFNINGYHSISAGLHFLIFGAFAGVELPKQYPDISSVSFGIYSDFPVPKLPIRFNIGFASRTEAVRNALHSTFPVRIMNHIGAGVGFKLPLEKWLNIGAEPGWLRFGVRSSLTPLLFQSVKSELENATPPHVDSIFKRTAWSVGVVVPY